MRCSMQVHVCIAGLSGAQSSLLVEWTNPDAIRQEPHCATYRLNKRSLTQCPRLGARP